jgi:EmrB/QacA subfamily drug resistance transporter
VIQQCLVSSATGRWILLATLLASGTAFLMGTAVVVALPTIQVHFSTTITGIQWVVNAHLLSLAAMLLICGSLGDHFGRKRIFISGISIFAIGAILSGFAGSIGQLIAFQAIQGMGSALMIPQSLAIINACFIETHRGRAIGLWAGLSGGIAALGPWLGGWLVETFSWQAVFFITAPLSILVVAVTAVFIPENRDPGARKLDWWGTLLIFLGLFGIAYGLISGPIAGWHTLLVLISLVGGVVAIILFVLIELRQPEPLVPLHIFRNPLVAGANTVTFFLYFALNGVIFFLVLNLQQVQGYSPTIAGIGLLPPIVLITFLAGPAGALSDRIGPRLQMVSGPVIVALGIALLTIGGTEASYFEHFLPGLMLFGIGMALVIAPLTKSALFVEPQYSGSASGVNNSVSRIAALMAVAVLGAIVISTFTASLNSIIVKSNLTYAEQEQILSQSDRLGGIIVPDTFSETSQQLVRSAVREAFIYSFRWAMAVGAILALIGSLVSLVCVRNPTLRQAPSNNLPP